MSQFDRATIFGLVAIFGGFSLFIFAFLAGAALLVAAGRPC